MAENAGPSGIEQALAAAQDQVADLQRQLAEAETTRRGLEKQLGRARKQLADEQAERSTLEEHMVNRLEELGDDGAQVRRGCRILLPQPLQLCSLRTTCSLLYASCKQRLLEPGRIETPPAPSWVAARSELSMLYAPVKLMTQLGRHSQGMACSCVEPYHVLCVCVQETVAAYEAKYNRLKSRYRELTEVHREEVDKLHDEIASLQERVVELEAQTAQLEAAK
jgi:DNA repair exonuclease SbcCD ATPase subunit